MHKKILYLLLTVLLLSSAYLISYIIATKGDEKALLNSGGANISRFIQSQETKAPYGLLNKLPSEKVSYPKLSLDGRSVTYYNATSGYLHEVKLTDSGNTDTPLHRLKPYLQGLDWSSDGKLLAYDGADYIVYDLSKGSFITLGSSIDKPSFSPFEDRVGYVWNDTKTNLSSISVADTSFTSYKQLLPVSDNNWKIEWTGKNTLSLIYSVGRSSSLFSLDTENKNLKRIESNKENLSIKWSANGNGLLYSYGPEDKLLFFYHNMLNGQLFQIPKSVSASKCTWSIDNKTIYCAADNGSNDEFFTWETDDQNIQLLKTDASVKVKAEDLFLSADENYLFFRNSFDGSLYRLKIEITK